jgi:hypothetical protein
MQFPKWQAFLNSHPLNKAGNKNSTVFITAWLALTANDVNFGMIFNEETLTIITVNANNKGVVMYSFKNPGGTLLNPTNKFACLIGSGRVASTVIVDKTSLLLPLIIATPTFVTIISCLDEQEIGAIAHPTQINNNPHNLCCSASFLLAPWVLGAILEADSNNPATLLLATNDTANKFDHSHENKHKSQSGCGLSKQDFYLIQTTQWNQTMTIY